MAHNRIIELIVDGIRSPWNYRSAAELMIKLDRPEVFTSWDRRRKAKAVERCAIALKNNHTKLQSLRESPHDIAEKARQQTKEDCRDVFPETNKSLNELLNDDEENES